ncbi:MAG: 50S ribosomal protein L25 [Desulfovibrionaceae bacterium]
MSSYTLYAEERSSGGNSNILRKQGFIPAVLYTVKGEATSIVLSSKEVTKLHSLIGNTTVVELILVVNGKEEKYPVLIWDFQVNPVKGHLIHVDLYAIEKDKEVVVRVPLVFTGTPKSIKLGAKLEIFREYIDIKTRPQNLVSKIECDISEINVNEKLFIKDIVLPQNIAAVYVKDVIVLSLTLKEAEADTKAKA